MAGSSLKDHPFQKCPEENRPPSARSVQGCAQSSSSHLKIYPSAVTVGCCAIIQVAQLVPGFSLVLGFFLGSTCMACSTIRHCLPGSKGSCEPWPAHPCCGSKRKSSPIFPFPRFKCPSPSFSCSRRAEVGEWCLAKTVLYPGQMDRRAPPPLPATLTFYSHMWLHPLVLPLLLGGGQTQKGAQEGFFLSL